MAIEIGLDTSQLTEIEKQLIHVAQKSFPKETTRFMKQEAGKLRQKAVRDAKSKVDKNTGNYIKGFKKGKKVYQWSDAEYNIRVFNDSPHAHLIENGHNITTRGKKGRPLKKGTGKVTGFVVGKFVLSTASIKFRDEFNRDLEDFAAETLERGLR